MTEESFSDFLKELGDLFSKYNIDLTDSNGQPALSYNRRHLMKYVSISSTGKISGYKTYKF